MRDKNENAADGEQSEIVKSNSISISVRNVWT